MDVIVGRHRNLGIVVVAQVLLVLGVHMVVVVMMQRCMLPPFGKRVRSLWWPFPLGLGLCCDVVGFGPVSCDCGLCPHRVLGSAFYGLWLVVRRYALLGRVLLYLDCLGLGCGFFPGCVHGCGVGRRIDQVRVVGVVIFRVGSLYGRVIRYSWSASGFCCSNAVFVVGGFRRGLCVYLARLVVMVLF